jgi:Domain of unknown function (DUF4157)
MYAHDFDLTVAPPARTARSRERSPDAPPHVQAVLDLQRLAGNENVNAMLEDEQPSAVRDVVGSGGGSPLEPGTRSLMEERLGQDFSDVRVHTGQKADESARSISAQAYTVGTDVVFRSGSYSPDTDGGRRVLAHELTHVVQQKSGPVAGTPAPGGIRLSDPSDAFEQAAERTADRAMTEPVSTSPAAAGDGAAVQREGEEDQDSVQPLVAQRQEEEEEEPAG